MNHCIDYLLLGKFTKLLIVLGIRKVDYPWCSKWKKIKFLENYLEDDYTKQHSCILLRKTSVGAASLLGTLAKSIMNQMQLAKEIGKKQYIKKSTLLFSVF